VGWNDSLNQSIGLLGRVESPGFGTTKGYAFTYSTAGSITLSLLDNEHLTTLASKTVTLDPTKSYRLQFDCYGPILSGLVLQKGAWNPVAFVQVEDSTYGQGATGLYLFSNAGNGTADATFDNYEAVAAVPEPSTVSLLALAFAPLLWVKIWRRTGRKPVRGTTEQR
jgi:hypothetical protein